MNLLNNKNALCIVTTMAAKAHHSHELHLPDRLSSSLLVSWLCVFVYCTVFRCLYMLHVKSVMIRVFQIIRPLLCHQRQTMQCHTMVVDPGLWLPRLLTRILSHTLELRLLDHFTRQVYHQCLSVDVAVAECHSLHLSIHWSLPRVGPGHPSSPLSIYFLIFTPFTFPFLSLALPYSINQSIHWSLVSLDAWTVLFWNSVLLCTIEWCV